MGAVNGSRPCPPSAALWPVRFIALQVMADIYFARSGSWRSPPHCVLWRLVTLTAFL